MATTAQPRVFFWRRKPRSPRRNDATRWYSTRAARLVVALGIVAISASAIAARWILGHAALRDGVETQSVHRGRLMVTISADGNLESANNAELKCQVKGGAKIISIVPDGTRVESGAELVQLDRSLFEQQLDAQKILYERAVATKIQAEQDYQAAEISVREYLEGTYLKDLKTAQQQITVARQNLDTDQNIFSHTERMYRKGFVTNLQLEADRFSVEHARLDLQAAETAKRVLQEFTRAKMLKQLEAVRDAADARRHSELASVNLEKAKLERIQDQLKFCTITAPQSGMVIYANDVERGRGSSDTPQIEEGAMVRERQTIIRLPDLNNMQVQTTVHESRVPHIRPGLPARINILGHEWNGRVKSVANRPAPPPFRYATPTKNYSVYVTLDGNTSGLKPGMTARVELLLADLRDVCTVPVAAVVEQGDRYYAWTRQGERFEKRPVTIGATDDRVIVIKEGLAAGDVVVTNPRATIAEAMHFETPEINASEDDSRFRSSVKIVEPSKAPPQKPAVSQNAS